MSRKRALVVGIDKYPFPNALPSCVADAEAFSKILSETYKFNSIKILRNAEASKNGIDRALVDLCHDAQSSDRLVFFFSGHGYTMANGGIREEALVAQDGKFFTDNELVARLRGVPAGIMTIVLDSCFSGGMEKVFVTAKGLEVTRIKAWIPLSDQSSSHGLANEPFKEFRPFGVSGIPATATKHFTATSSELTKGVVAINPASDEIGQVQMSAALLSACLETETASASTSQTGGLSAFTYSLLKALRRLGQHSSALTVIGAAGKELKQAAFQQTPVIKWKPAVGDLGSRTFITLEKIAMNTNTKKGLTTDQTEGEDTVENDKPNGAEDSQPESEMDQKGWLDSVTRVITHVLPVVLGAMKDYQPNGAKDLEPGAELDQKGWLDSVTRVITQVLPAVLGAMRDDQPNGAKDLEPGAELDQKGWLDSVTRVITHVLPVVLGAMKDYQPNGAKDLEPGAELDQKGWFDRVTRVIGHVVPVVLGAMKDYHPNGAKDAEPGAELDQKGWFSSVTHALRVAVPVAMALL